MMKKQERQLSGKEIEEKAMSMCINTADQALATGGVLDPRGLRWQGSSLESAYERCGVVCSEYAKTFYLGTQLMTPVQAKCIWAVYVWCRRTDELVDGPNASKITPQVSQGVWGGREGLLCSKGGQAPPTTHTRAQSAVMKLSLQA